MGIALAYRLVRDAGATLKQGRRAAMTEHVGVNVSLDASSARALNMS